MEASLSSLVWALSLLALVACSSSQNSTVAADASNAQCEPPCLNGGIPIHVNVNGSVFCECQCPQPQSAGDTFYAGEHCGTPATLCDTDGSYCATNGTCRASTTGGLWHCDCKSPYFGFLCQQVGTPCGPNLICLNNAHCIASPNGVLGCQCLSRYSGSDCGLFDVTYYQSRRSRFKWWYIFVGVVGATIVFAVLIVAVVGYIKWKRRYRNFEVLLKPGQPGAGLQ